MQRELKFRAYHLIEKKYVPIIGFDLEHSDYVIRIDDMPVIVPMKILHVQQFTGYKDMDKKEIFEGDLLRQVTDACSCKPGSIIDYDPLYDHWEVSWDDHIQGWNTFPKRKPTMTDEDFNMAIECLGGLITWPSKDVLNNSWHYKIIGNIYENPELSQDVS